MPFFGASGAAWDDGMVARWGANPLGMLWPEMDVAFVTWGGGPPATTWRPVVVIAAGFDPPHPPALSYALRKHRHFFRAVGRAGRYITNNRSLASALYRGGMIADAQALSLTSSASLRTGLTAPWRADR